MSDQPRTSFSKPKYPKLSIVPDENECASDDFAAQVAARRRRLSECALALTFSPESFEVERTNVFDQSVVNASILDDLDKIYGVRPFYDLPSRLKIVANSDRVAPRAKSSVVVDFTPYYEGKDALEGLWRKYRLACLNPYLADCEVGEGGPDLIHLRLHYSQPLKFDLASILGPLIKDFNLS